MRVLITGGNGFLGHFLIRELLAQGIEPVSYDIVPMTRLMGDLVGRVEFVLGSVLHPTEILRTCKRLGVTRIIHLPALMTADSRRSPLSAYELNVMGTINVLEVASVLELERVVCASSVAVYSSTAAPQQTEEDAAAPSTVYGTTKLAVEQLGAIYAQDHNLQFIALRPTRLYGPGRARGDLERMVTSLLRGEGFRWMAHGPLELLYVADEARAFALATVADLPRFRVFNTCSPAKHSASEVAGALRKALPELWQKSTKALPPTPSAEALLPRMDSRRAEKELGWRPETSLEEGVRSLVAWLSRDVGHEGPY
jgi:nucleoside-diphosphate-sugar epimerase